ncbi:hypothetical protein D1632_00390 [Chryseobacterium nematophagum]|uniref:Uncharacterized protein n=1 Tax=Chryseobacterium nematophagum TaxID=2305228 RepID=A0A3M7LGP9_9FLAO|nr:hypothetical protein [Chryseobacterium nematophagum]RMZ61304.1 hypothetical protein D1632_00390 [Chryseobacterium nematophagum]
MKILFIVLGAYLVYFIGQIIYDAFITKPKSANRDQVEDQSIVLEDHESLVPESEREETRVVNFDSVENLDSSDHILNEEIEERTEEQILLDARKKMEEESYIENEASNSTASFSEVDSNSFIMKFQELLQGDNLQTISNEVLKNEIDIQDFLQNATKITSFNYSGVQLFQ